MMNKKNLFDFEFELEPKKPMTEVQKGRIARRIMSFGTIIICFFCILWLMFYGTDSVIHQNIILGSFGLIGSVVGFYVTGAAYQDVNTEKIKAVAQVRTAEVTASAKKPKASGSTTTSNTTTNVTEVVTEDER